ncbi:MAG: hypothetical protein WBN04_19600 [Paracoccaceae bacterium]
MKKFLSRFATALGAIGLMGSTAAHAQSFNSASEARSYLSQNPTGPRAEQAFRRVVEDTLTSNYPEFSRRALADGNALVVAPDATVSRAAILSAIAELANATSTTRPAPTARPARPGGGGDNNDQAY